MTTGRGPLPIQQEHVDGDLAEDKDENVEELQGERGDDVVLDEFLLVGGRQQGVHVGLLFEEYKPVEGAEEDDRQEDVGQVAGGGHYQLHQAPQVHPDLTGPLQIDR